MLLIDHRQSEVLVADGFLEDGVGADEDVDAAVCKAHQGGFAHPALFAAGEDGDSYGQTRRHLSQRFIMLAGEDFRRSEECALSACLNRVEEGHERDKGFA